MIRYTQGNLLAADTQALVNTVNTVGVSGKGIALMFKESYPENFRAYEAVSKAGQLAPGGLFITEREDMLGPRFIVNFATKKHWRHPSKLEWIEHGLTILREEIKARGIRSIAIPPLGAGNGGLEWNNVKPLIVKALADLDCEVVVYEPTQTYQNVVKRNGVEKLTPARALMAEMIRRYEVLGFDCSILEAQKLAWFLSGAIQRLSLPNLIADDFVANRYGPYSDKVRHLLDGLDGSYLTCERRVADARPFDPIRFQHNRQDRITVYLTSPEANLYRPALDAASKIIDGFQSPHGLELLATVDWLNRESHIALKSDAMMSAIASWPGPEGAAQRKARVFTQHHVNAAVDHLQSIQSEAT
ncbi:type II toxin-antitoxin system antitoxin DNA ADP-ribosyl glycohydrolase DarG [Nitrospirillum viridazoti]|uniref:Appr-1-p processing protein n=1 Tax=Nitrospirillum viridazoti CBAmc TaxID=1441467 RepID=A0A248JM11_9PROT|nr:macro domain-containing protein [Nitrospirillum amazonense]ASG19773.1 Appr-1-p processing protein [Nitrospirillum amazonense CBAmc]TWB27303.1 O-acetyl-ADP-ribose deacetylase (regulator of RNase III) [Nitrospirillum amazonense]